MATTPQKSRSAEDGSSEGKGCAVAAKIGLRGSGGVLQRGLPITGIASYTALSLNVLNPSLMNSIVSRKDFTAWLLLYTTVGCGVYLGQRAHLASVEQPRRVLYAVYGASIFSLGSVLLWAVLRTVLPETPAVRSAVGVGSSLFLLSVGRSYLDHVDSLVPAEAESQ